MKQEKIFDGITGIREDIIERAVKYDFENTAAKNKKEKKITHKAQWMKWVACAERRSKLLWRNHKLHPVHVREYCHRSVYFVQFHR